MNRRLLFIGRGTYLNVRTIVELSRHAPCPSGAYRGHFEIRTLLSNHLKKKTIPTKFYDEQSSIFHVYENEPAYEGIEQFLQQNSYNPEKRS